MACFKQEDICYQMPVGGQIEMMLLDSTSSCGVLGFCAASDNKVRKVVTQEICVCVFMFLENYSQAKLSS